MADLDVAAAVQSPTGWIELDDPDNGYELHKDAFAKRSVSHRKTEIQSEWVGGTFVARSVRENVNEDVVVWVMGQTPYEMRTRLEALTDAFDQLSYGMRFRDGDVEETWICTVADFAVETSQEIRNATWAIVRATVPRNPKITIAQVV